MATKRDMQGVAELPQYSRSGETVHSIRSSLNNSFSYTIVNPYLEVAVVESGCTSHFLLTTSPCDDKVPVLYGVKYVRMPNGETMTKTHNPNPIPPTHHI